MPLVQLHDLQFQPLLKAEILKRRVQEIGNDLHQTFGEVNPIFIPILKGAFVFAADLIRHFPSPCEVMFTQFSSYRGVQSSGEVKTALQLDAEKLRGRHLIIVEDILDSGRTLHHFLQFLKTCQPASVNVVVLLRKPDALEFEIQINQVGFDIENKFVVGYGLDYNELGRNLPGIFVLKETN